MRLFFAVQLGADVITRVAAHIDALRAEASDGQLAWETPEKLHYTLKFLGDVDVDELHMEALTHAAEVARDVAPFALAPGALGAFPDEAAPRVLWLGVDEGAEAMSALATKLDVLLGGYGYAREARPYRPHLTVARATGKSGQRSLASLLGAVRPRIDFGPTRIDRFVLMQSSDGTSRVRLTFVLGAPS